MLVESRETNRESHLVDLYNSCEHSNEVGEIERHPSGCWEGTLLISRTPGCLGKIRCGEGYRCGLQITEWCCGNPHGKMQPGLGLAGRAWDGYGLDSDILKMDF